MNIPTCVSALLAAAFLVACDESGEVGDADFEGRWVFVSGTTVRVCQTLTDSFDGGGLADAGATTEMVLLSGTETFVAEDGGSLSLIDGAFGFPSTCRLAVTRDGGTAVAVGCHFGDAEGFGASSVTPQTFEISGDRSSLSFTGSYSNGTHDINFRWYSGCTYSTTGTLRRP